VVEEEMLALPVLVPGEGSNDKTVSLAKVFLLYLVFTL
jgi:hypothetical protein